MDDYISRSEHEEFRRSMDLANKNLEDENRRQNKRLDMLEEISKQNTALVTNVERLAVNMENMLKVQEQQGDRLETLEKRDEITALITNVERLAVNMENMLKVQEQQGKRLDTLESRDGKKWRTVIDHFITVAVGAVAGYLFNQLGM